jgi:hypothetical protein
MDLGWRDASGDPRPDRPRKGALQEAARSHVRFALRPSRYGAVSILGYHRVWIDRNPNGLDGRAKFKLRHYRAFELLAFDLPAIQNQLATVGDTE